MITAIAMLLPGAAYVARADAEKDASTTAGTDTPRTTLAQLVARFNELMDKQQYADAEVIARQAKQLEPDSTTVQAMLWKATFARKLQMEAQAKQTIPSPYYIDDDIQYFPAGPEFRLNTERAAARRQLRKLVNSGFDEPPAREAISGWTHAASPNVEITSDTNTSHNGKASLRVTNADKRSVASIRSDPFVPPATGGISVDVWLRVENDFRKPTVRIAMEGLLEGKSVYRFSQIDAGSEFPKLRTKWQKFGLRVDELPNGVTDIRVGFDVMGEGRVWIDDVQVFEASSSTPNLNNAAQYFPVERELKHHNEHRVRRDKNAPIPAVYRPLVTKCDQDLVPIDDEVLRALESKRRFDERDELAVLQGKHVKNVRIVKERIADYIDPPSSSWSAGSVQVHHCHYKCTVYFTETNDVAWPIPHNAGVDAVEVVYIDVVHGHVDHILHTDDRGTPKYNDVPEETRIKELLKQQIDVDYDATPLHEFVKDVGERVGVNVHLDLRGLAAEGITKDEPVTLKVDQPIRVTSALNLVLSPLHLKYVIENEVVRVTSEQAGHEVYSKVYNVADLVIPIPEFVYLSNALRQLPPQESKLDFKPLIETIVTTIQPLSWEKSSGSGLIESFETNLSLVVSQSREIHRQIADLLEQLRRLHDVQVTCELQTVTMDQTDYKSIWDEPLNDNRKVLSPTEADLLLQILNVREKINVSRWPKVTLFPGQHLIAAVDFHPNRRSSFQQHLHLVPTVSADRRSLTLESATLADAEKFAQKKSRSDLADGHTLMIDVTDQLSTANADITADTKLSKSRTLVLITPRIIVSDEEANE